MTSLLNEWHENCIVTLGTNIYSLHQNLNMLTLIYPFYVYFFRQVFFAKYGYERWWQAVDTQRATQTQQTD